MHPEQDRYLANEIRINLFLYASMFLMIFASMFFRFLYPGRGYIAFFHDDFFYYLKIAENIYNYRFSSFNNMVLTNGYHPLWMFVLIILLSICKGSNIYFFLAVSSLISLSTLFTFLIINKIFKLFLNHTIVTVMLSGYLTSFALIMSKGGMEIHLAILVMCYLVYYVLLNVNNLNNKAILLKIGFLSSLLFLSRLDSIILIIILLLSFVEYKSIKNALKRFLFFSIGGILMPIYLVSNYIIFGTFVPMSGLAKQLKSTIWPSAQFVGYTLAFITKVYEGLLFVFPTIAITIIGLMIVIIKHKEFSKDRRINILMITILFPFVFIFIQSLISDWPPWMWYYYPLLISCLASIMIIYEYIIRIKKLEINPKIILVLLGIVLIFSFHSLYKRNISADLLKNSIYLASVKIAELFSNDTTDTLAMGDRAGIVGYLLKNPIVHLEGIVMDEKYLEFIRKEEDLEKVLKSYNVRYYIATNPKLIGKGCYEFVEPRKAGNHSHRMRATLCQKPVYEFWMGNYHTAIFKVE